MASSKGADGLVSSTISSLINGVSEQPSVVRLPSQGEVQENMLSKVDSGPMRRPPTEHIAEIIDAAAPTGGYHVHIRDVTEDEQWLVLIEDDDLRMFNLQTGVEATVSFPDGKGYLDNTSGDPAQKAFATVSVADYTFVVNKATVVAMSGSVSAVRPNEYILYFHDPATTGVASFWTATLGAAEQTANVDTSGGYPGQFRDEVYTDILQDSNGFFPRFSHSTISENLIYGVQDTPATPHDRIEHQYEWSDEIYTLVTSKIPKFEDLPARAKDGFTTEVVGTDGNEENNYWVKFEADSNAWVETVGPELDNAFDPTTMPHVLVKTGDTTFDFREQTWDDRRKGDIDSAPEPSFVGKTISDVVFHKNRLGFLSDENTILSEAAKFFNFWPTTVTTIIESDPIDAAGSNNRIALLDYGVPFDNNLYLFSSHGGVQNVLAGSDASLTTKNATVTEASAYSASVDARPKTVGKDIYFVVDRGASSGLQAYNIVDGKADATDVASHVPKYIPGNVVQLAASETEQMLVARSTDEPNRLYVYKFHFTSNQRKVQSSWSRWSFSQDDNILSADFVREILYLTIERPDGIHLEKINMRKIEDGDLGYRCYLDSLVGVSGSYDATTGLTTWTLPYDASKAVAPLYNPGERYEAILTDTLWRGLKNSSVPVVIASATTATAKGNWADWNGATGLGAHIGRRWEFEYEFSEPVIREAAQRGESNEGLGILTVGRLQLRKLKVFLKDVGAFVARVADKELGNIEVPEILFDFEDASDTDEWTLVNGFAWGGSDLPRVEGDLVGALISATGDTGTEHAVSKTADNEPLIVVRNVAGKKLSLWVSVSSVAALDELTKITIYAGSNGNFSTNYSGWSFTDAVFDFTDGIMPNWIRFVIDFDSAPDESVGVTDFARIDAWKLAYTTVNSPPAAGLQVYFDKFELLTTTPDEYEYEYINKAVDQDYIGPAIVRAEDEFPFDVGVESKNARIRLTGDTHLPFGLIGVEWEGNLTTRSAGV